MNSEDTAVPSGSGSSSASSGNSVAYASGSSGTFSGSLGTTTASDSEISTVTNSGTLDGTGTSASTNSFALEGSALAARPVPITRAVPLPFDKWAMQVWAPSHDAEILQDTGTILSALLGFYVSPLVVDISISSLTLLSAAEGIVNNDYMETFDALQLGITANLIYNALFLGFASNPWEALFSWGGVGLDAIEGLSGVGVAIHISVAIVTAIAVVAITYEEMVTEYNIYQNSFEI
jgi:hypothetical protein